MANGVARALTKRGLARGDRVAILSANRAEYLAAYYGIMRAGFVAVPVNFKFPQQTIHFIIKDSGAKLVFCDPQRRKDCPERSAGRHFGAEGADGFDAFLDDGSVRRDRARRRASRRCSSIPRARPARPRASCSRTRATSGSWRRGSRPGLDRHRYLIAAPLYHMNALALVQARLRRARHHRAAAAVHRARLYRGDRALPRHLAHRGAADDGDDAARVRPDGAAPTCPAWSSSAWARRR